MTVCEPARMRNAHDEWLKPTLLGAACDSGDVDHAASLAEEIFTQGPAAWKLKATLDDLRLERARDLDSILSRLAYLRASSGSAAAGQ
jgi:hypothetical protein